jgi:hypothetical protein
MKDLCQNLINWATLTAAAKKDDIEHLSKADQTWV